MSNLLGELNIFSCRGVRLQILHSRFTVLVFTWLFYLMRCFFAYWIITSLTNRFSHKYVNLGLKWTYVILRLRSVAVLCFGNVEWFPRWTYWLFLGVRFRMFIPARGWTNTMKVIIFPYADTQCAPIKTLLSIMTWLLTLVVNLAVMPICDVTSNLDTWKNMSLVLIESFPFPLQRIHCRWWEQCPFWTHCW